MLMLLDIVLMIIMFPLDARRFCICIYLHKEYKPFLKEQYISIDELNSVINTLDGSIFK